jgi:hypothetical protein
MPQAPLAFSDAEIDIVLDAARPLPIASRDLFLHAVANALSEIRERGPGVLYRICREQQKRFLVPPDVPRVASRWQREVPRFEKQSKRTH